MLSLFSSFWFEIIDKERCSRELNIIEIIIILNLKKFIYANNEKINDIYKRLFKNAKESTLSLIFAFKQCEYFSFFVLSPIFLINCSVLSNSFYISYVFRCNNSFKSAIKQKCNYLSLKMIIKH